MTKFKYIRIIRVILKPYMDWRRKHEYENYLRSADSQYLKTLKDIHIGKRCFIIGNGPSLTPEDLDKLCGEYTFAANRIYKILKQTMWRPTYYLSIDKDVLRESYKELNIEELGHLFLAVDKRVKLEGPLNKITRIFYKSLAFNPYLNIWNDLTCYISEDVSTHFSVGHTVTFSSIQLAIYMGFKEIYLLGVDFCYSTVRDAYGKVSRDKSLQDHFKGDYYKKAEFNYNSSKYAFLVAKEYCDSHGIKIYNATRGGKLEVFERVNFDSLIKEDGK